MKALLIIIFIISACCKTPCYYEINVSTLKKQSVIGATREGFFIPDIMIKSSYSYVGEYNYGDTVRLHLYDTLDCGEIKIHNQIIPAVTNSKGYKEAILIINQKNDT